MGPASAPTLTHRDARVSRPPPAKPGPPTTAKARMQHAAVSRTAGDLSRAAYPVSTLTASVYAEAAPAPCMASMARSSSCTAPCRTATCSSVGLTQSRLLEQTACAAKEFVDWSDIQHKWWKPLGSTDVLQQHWQCTKQSSMYGRGLVPIS